MNLDFQVGQLSEDDKGYAKIARNSNNLCDLSTDAVYPVIQDEFLQIKTMSD